MAIKKNNSILYFNRGLFWSEHMYLPGVERCCRLLEPIWKHTTLDRTGKIKLPVKCTILNDLKMPEYFLQINDTLDQLCQERAIEIFERARLANNDIAVMWSGGIDSTCVLVSLLKTGSCDDIKRIIVIHNQDSIIENTKFYNEYIKDKLRTYPSSKFEDLINDQILFITGEGGDQISHADFNVVIASGLGEDSINLPATADNIINSLSLKTNKHFARGLFSILEPMLKSSPFKIKTLFQNFWYINFNVNWQPVYLRLLLSLSVEAASRVNEKYVKNNYMGFFITEKFQHWVASNWHLVPPNNWSQNKQHLKKIIYDFDKDEKYYLNKKKMDSGGLLHKVNKFSSRGYITNEYKIIDTLNGNINYLEKTHSFL
jgi:hypothetical protein